MNAENSAKKLDIKSVTLEELEEYIVKFGQPDYRAAQILNWLYNQRVKNRVDNLMDMKNLSKACYNSILPYVDITSLQLKRSIVSDDSDILKYIFETKDKYQIIAIVRNNILEIATQIGCKFNCKYCIFGKQAFVRNLSTGEIIDQLVKVQNHIGFAKAIKYIHFSGCGEPLLNLKNLLKSIKIINNTQWGLGVFLRYFYVYSSGLIPEIRKISDSGWPVHIVVGLHSPDDKIRSFLSSVGEENKIEPLFEALLRHKKKTGRRIILDYVLIDGLNDSMKDAKKLCDILKGVPFEVRISMYNHLKDGGLYAPVPENQEKFIEYLLNNNTNISKYQSRGIDIDAGLGQSSIENNSYV